MNRHRAAAQHAGIARFYADARSISSYIGARLVHHSHHAQRHGNLSDKQAVFECSLLKDLARRVVKRSKAFKGRCHALDAALVQKQAIDQRFLRSCLSGLSAIDRVFRADKRCVFAKGSRHCEQRLVLQLGRGFRHSSAGSLGPLRRNLCFTHSNTTNSSRWTAGLSPKFTSNSLPRISFWERPRARLTSEEGAFTLPRANRCPS